MRPRTLVVEDDAIGEATRREHAQAKEQLQEAQGPDSVGDLVAGIALGFDLLLHRVLGHTQHVINQLHLADARLEQMEQIRADALRGRELSRQLLILSRRRALDLRVVDLGEVVRQAEGLLRGTLRADVRLRASSPGESCLVKADVGQIEEMLMHLAVNAREAMPGGGELSIAVAPSTRDEADPVNRCVELTVSDTGCGMDAFTRKHAFEPFFTSKEPGQGAGLGLAVVQAIVQQHAGSIELESGPGRGTTIRIALPSAAEGTSGLIAEPAGAVDRGAGTILLVEDEPVARRLVQEMLAAAGHAVIAAPDGAEALALAEQRRGRVDLLLTDVTMPGMSGPDLARRLGERWPETAVLFISGQTEELVAQHLTGLPHARVLEKPFTSATLLGKVREMLAGREPAKASLRHRTVLLVDDDPSVRLVGRGILERLGYTVVEAANGREALSEYERHRAEIELVILDQLMPEMGGAEAFAALKERAPHVPIFFTCAELQADVARTFLGLGVAGFVHKPYTIAEMLRALAAR